MPNNESQNFTKPLAVLALALIVGGGYYIFFYDSNTAREAKSPFEIIGEGFQPPQKAVHEFHGVVTDRGVAENGSEYISLGVQGGILLPAASSGQAEEQTLVFFVTNETEFFVLSFDDFVENQQFGVFQGIAAPKEIPGALVNAAVGSTATIEAVAAAGAENAFTARRVSIYATE